MCVHKNVLLFRNGHEESFIFFNYILKVVFDTANSTYPFLRKWNEWFSDI